MNASNNSRLAAKKAAGINIHLYSDDHPETTLKGTGFKDAATARRTIELVRAKPRNRQVWTINAMYHRAKHHPSQTPAMRDAMRIFEGWLAAYHEEKRRTGRGRKEKTVDRAREAAETERDRTDGDDGPAPPGAKKPRTRSLSAPPLALSSESRRSRLESEYKTLFNVTLPEVARSKHWPIHLNHCLMRVALDAYWQCCWYDRLDQKKGALKSMSVPQIENVIVVGKRMAAEGKAYVTRLNQQSLAYRNKRGPGGKAGSSQSSTKENAKKTSTTQPKLHFTTPCDGLSDPCLAKSVSSGSDGKTKASSSEDSTDGIVDTKSERSEVNKDALPQVQRAITGRAACRGCREQIGKAEHRVGVKAWSSGREVTVWYRPACFLAVVRVERLGRGTTARCKYTGSGFAKGDLRLVVEAGASKHHYDALAAIRPLLAPVYDVLEETGLSEPDARGSDLRGLDQLNRDDRAAILAALRPAKS